MDEPEQVLDGWVMDRARGVADLPPWWEQPNMTRRPPYDDPLFAYDTMHYGWTGDWQWARTVRPNPRYL